MSRRGWQNQERRGWKAALHCERTLGTMGRKKTVARQLGLLPGLDEDYCLTENGSLVPVKPARPKAPKKGVHREAPAAFRTGRKP